jgi:hypothetical protein
MDTQPEHDRDTDETQSAHDRDTPKLDALEMAQVEMGTATNRLTGEVCQAVRLTQDGKTYLGLGDTPREALLNAMRQIYPKLETVEFTGQAAWSPLAKEVFGGNDGNQ